jgi:mannitol/fructose-specific phosphotransferase system IIA component
VSETTITEMAAGYFAQTETLETIAHERAELIMRNVFGAQTSNWPNGLCLQIVIAIREAQQEGAKAVAALANLADKQEDALAKARAAIQSADEYIAILKGENP